MSWSSSATSPSLLPPEPAASRARPELLVLLAAALTLAIAVWQQDRQRDPHVPYGRFELPGFDAYVYVAMAERPAVFTVAPWGYRLDGPALVHAMGLRNVVRGFRLLSMGAMTAAGGLLFLFLRRRGHAAWAALLGVALFALAPPAARAVETPFFCEPLGLLLLLALLVAVEAGAGWGAFALLSAILTLAKDGVVVIALLPAIFLARAPRGGRGALAAGLAAALPAMILPPALRAWWTPQIPVIAAPWNADLVRAAASSLREAWAPTAVAALAGGLLPLALLGALRGEGRAYLRRYGPSLVLLSAMALLAWLRVPSREPVPLFGANFERVLVYAVPLLVPLALLALDRILPNVGPAPPAAEARGQVAPALAALAVIAMPFLLLDRYRRVDLQATRDGPLVLAVCRESWRWAVRLQEGEEIVFDPASRRFTWGESDPGQLGRMRWVLRDGWGERPHYATGEVVMQGAEASLLLPVLTPADLDLRLRVMSPSPTALSARVNGVPVGAWLADATAPEEGLRIPARLLFRGDNELTLASAGSVGARLRELRYRRAAP